MAVGTGSGLLEDPDGAPQSYFKHSIIESYLLPFVSMVGSSSADSRVVVLDGYAGQGRYDNGAAGSSELLLQAAERASSAQVSVFLVESNKASFNKLSGVASEYMARGVSVQAHKDSVENHLPNVLEAAEGVPLFLLLDPCGAVLPFDELTGVLSASRSGRWPPTELLLNFSARFTTRAAGALVKGQYENDGVRKLDITCGGDWWRAVALQAHQESTDGTFLLAGEAVVKEYARRLAAQAGNRATSIIIPVRARRHHQPIYHLVFLTRSNYGIWVFADAVGTARKKWLKKIGPLDEDESQDEGLFSIGDIVDDIIEAEQERTYSVVEKNLKLLLDKRGSVPRLVDDPQLVFDGCLGYATESMVRRAVRKLESTGEARKEQPRRRHVRDWSLDRNGYDARGGI